MGPAVLDPRALMVRRTAVIVACTVSAVYLCAWTPYKMAHTFQRSDPALFSRAVDSMSTGSMYNPIQPAGPHRFGHYQYPPVLIPMLSWLPDHSPLGVQRFLLFMGSVGLVAFGVGVARMGRWPLWPAVPLVMGTYIVLTAATVPGEGNLEPFLPGIVALGLCAPWGVPLLVLAAALKVAPGWAVFVLAARGRRDALLAASATLLILLAVALTIGPDRLWAESMTWTRDIAPSPAQGQYESGHWAWGGPDRLLAAFLLQGNLSPVFAPLILLGDPYPHELPGWARTYLTAASTGIPLFVAWRTRRLEPRAQAAVVLAAAVLCAPIFRLGYLPMLMPGAVILWQSRRARVPKPMEVTRGAQALS